MKKARGDDQHSVRRNKVAMVLCSRAAEKGKHKREVREREKIKMKILRLMEIFQLWFLLNDYELSCNCFLYNDFPDDSHFIGEKPFNEPFHQSLTIQNAPKRAVKKQESILAAWNRIAETGTTKFQFKWQYLRQRQNIRFHSIQDLLDE